MAVLMPRAARCTALTLRAFNLELAHVHEAVRGNLNAGRLRMAFWRDFLNSVYSSGGHSHPLASPFKSALQRHALTNGHLHRLVDARDEDLDGVAPSSMTQLESVAERSAGSLLYLNLEACDVTHPTAFTAARAAGVGVGIATLLRAMPVHALHGRRYIPDDVLRRFELREEDVLLRPHELIVNGQALGAADPPTVTPAVGVDLTVDLKSSGGAATPSRLSATLFDLDSEHGPAEQPFRRSGGMATRAAPMVVGEFKSKSRSPAAAATTPSAAPALHAGHGHSHAPPTAVSASTAGKDGGVKSIDPRTVVVRKDEAVMQRVRNAVEAVATVAEEHIAHARSLASELPPEAAAPLLQVVPSVRFLAQLRAARHDIFGRGVGVWTDTRAFARQRLQADLLWHVIRNTY